MTFSTDKTSLEISETPLVSVLCPTYNAEKYIKATLDSLASQTYSNIEVILSDDCSTDSTVDIIQNYLKDSQLNVVLNVNPVNLGITPNCNKALSLCSGEYIAFFAGDDLMYPGKIDGQVELMQSDNDCTICYHSVDILDGDNENKILFTTEQSSQRYGSFVDIIAGGGFVGVCSVMVRANAIPSHGFSESLPKVSDWLMTIEVALRGKVIKLDGVHGGYLRHSKGASRQTFETLWEIRETLDFIKNRYSNNALICNATNVGYRRILIGEIARLFLVGNSQRLLELKKIHMKDQGILSILWWFVYIMVRIRVNRLKPVGRLYEIISSGVK
jgi:glycosyltransferase involved in cell wall biosynthesis